MDITVTVRLSAGEVDAMAASLTKFERMRSIPGLVLIGALAVVALIALPALPAGVAVVGFLLMGALTFSWLRGAHKAGAAAREFTQQSVVAASDQGLLVTRGTSTSETEWSDVVQATKTKTGWIFVSRRGEATTVIPSRVLTDAEVGQLTTLLSTWSARRYRRSPF
ncbi:YcxB family protein [Streptacidiphilus sp. PAMC 29251]